MKCSAPLSDAWMENVKLSPVVTELGVLSFESKGGSLSKTDTDLVCVLTQLLEVSFEEKKYCKTSSEVDGIVMVSEYLPVPDIVELTWVPEPNQYSTHTPESMILSDAVTSKVN